MSLDTIVELEKEADPRTADSRVAGVCQTSFPASRPLVLLLLPMCMPHAPVVRDALYGLQSYCRAALHVPASSLLPQ